MNLKQTAELKIIEKKTILIIIIIIIIVIINTIKATGFSNKLVLLISSI